MRSELAVVILAGAVASAIPVPAQSGEPSRQSRAATVSVPADRIATLRVHASGGWEYIPPADATGGGGSVAGTQPCGPVTYTDPDNFTAPQPVTLAIQQGFAEGEVAYASYLVDPTLYPIKLESFEMVFAQQTNVPTVTHWSLLIWDGPPSLQQGGIPMLTISSNDIEFPHLRMDAGLQATDLQIVVDPSDPEQIILFNDSGTNMFTIGFRIDQHNNPPADACLFPPDPLSNAFPVTDVDGIADLDNNWLDALTCGGLCDGLNRFLTLPLGCAPSGDWVIRASFSCTLVGACCDVNGVCAENVADTLCREQGGTFMGENASCATITCPEPVGACCFQGSPLCDVTEPTCVGLSGAYMGNGSDCNTVDCTTGACCLSDGSCIDTVEPACIDRGGSFQGGTSCSAVRCPQPIGACCVNGTCLENQPRDTCEAVGTWNGEGSTCTPDPCLAQLCPPATVLEANPPSGTVDARQTHPVDALLPRTGIGSVDEDILIDLGVDGADPVCFTLCETAPDPQLGPNDIDSVTPMGNGLYRILLVHPLSPGARTVIRYAGHTGTIEYVSHPGNVTGSDAVDENDVTALRLLLQSGPPAALPVYRADLDRSGSAGPADLLRLIDLLNGAGTFAPWLGSPPPPPTCPP
ncbi:MAG: hypothetical protein D6788_11390 [Planctomycetota bacterium]|nr:MAG: hypothetical protein D6788_11390 [Planctomycetota bacterium]